MGVSRLYFTPLDGAVEKTIDLETGLGIQRFRGFLASDEVGTITVGGKHTSVVHGAYWAYELNCEAISRTANQGVWHRLTQFLAHAQAGGEFGFAMDDAAKGETTTDMTVNENATGAGVADETPFAAGDRVVLEHLTDFRKTEVLHVSGTTPGIVNFTYSTAFGYPVGSAMRHAEWFPKLRLLSPTARNFEFVERDAGRGVNLWDLRLRFRTVK